MLALALTQRYLGNGNVQWDIAELQDRTVVIIGGTTGLGLSAAKACLRAGASVVVCGRNAESVGAASDQLWAPSARVFVGDATDPTTADTAIQLAIDAFGRFDALYHVAGGSGRAAGDGPLHEVTRRRHRSDAAIESRFADLFESRGRRRPFSNAAAAVRCSTWAACWDRALRRSFSPRTSMQQRSRPSSASPRAAPPTTHRTTFAST